MVLVMVLDFTRFDLYILSIPTFVFYIGGVLSVKVTGLGNNNSGARHRPSLTDEIKRYPTTASRPFFAVG